MATTAAMPEGKAHFRRQATIGPYFADFACHTIRLVIELDGGQHGHGEQALRDATRDAYFRSNGYRVLRFWNNDVLTKPGRRVDDHRSGD